MMKIIRLARSIPQNSIQFSHKNIKYVGEPKERQIYKFPKNMIHYDEEQEITKQFHFLLRRNDQISFH